MKILFRYLKAREWLFMAISAVCIVIQVYFEMKIPEMISGVSSMIQQPGVQVIDVVKQGALMFLYILGSLLLSIVAANLISRMSSVFSERMRNAIFERTMEFSIGEVGKLSSSSLITRCTGDVLLIQLFVVTGLQVLVKAPVTAIWGIQRISAADFRLTTATVIAVVCIVIFMVTTILLTIPMSKKIQIMTDNINRETKEHISGIQVIKAFLSEKFHQKRFDDVTEEMKNVNIRLNRIMAFLSPGLVLALNMLNLSMVIIGAFIVDTSSYDIRPEKISQILSFTSYAIMIVTAFITLVNIFMLLPRAITSMGRVGEVLKTETAITDGSFSGEAPKTDTAVEFKNVCFRYEGAASDALSDINFEVKKGETLAVIGATGSGKTSLINLIPRLYDTTGGSVLVNGVDVRDYHVHELRNMIGYVPQKSFLFTGTIAGNIDYGENGKMANTLKEIKKAAEIGQAKEFIESKEGAYQSPVFAGGMNFSGGQRQRLTISRAICRDPEIYIFDDSFSALDFKTDRILREKLRENAEGATIILIAQRIGTVKSADRIIVLENGCVVGNGKHEELIRDCDVYREIALSQLSEQEVADI